MPEQIRLTHYRWYQDGFNPDSLAPQEGEDSCAAVTLTPPPLQLRLQSQWRSRDAKALSRRLEWRETSVGPEAWREISTRGSGDPVFLTDVVSEGAAILAPRLSPPWATSSLQFVGGEWHGAAGDTATLVLNSKNFVEDVWRIGVRTIRPGIFEFRATASGRPFANYDAIPKLLVASRDDSGGFATRFYQRGADNRPHVWLNFWRDGAWFDASERLLFPLTVSRRLGGVATAELLLDNADGALAPDNPMSSWNLNEAGEFDPLLDENRKMRLDVSGDAFGNLSATRSYTTTPAPSSAHPDPGGRLVNGAFGGEQNENDSQWVGWQGATVRIVQTLYAPAAVKGAGISLLSRTTAGVYLPSSATVRLAAADGEHAFPLPLGHLADDPVGRRHCLYALDLDVPSVSAVTFELTASGPSHWVLCDEFAAWQAGIRTTDFRPLFTGVLADEITLEASPRGVIRLGQVRDTTKLLADSYQELFANYQGETVEAVIEDLLTSNTYGANIAAQSYCLEGTGFELPKWSEQQADLLEACVQLAHFVGWEFEADAEGCYRLRAVDWDSQSGRETYRADGDLYGWRPGLSGINLRNRIVVRSRDARSRDLRVTVEDADSIARYGVRLFSLFEPTMRTAPLARLLAQGILRDYAHVPRMGVAEVTGDARLWPGDVVTVVESGATASGNSQLYRVDALAHRITGSGCGDFTTVLELKGYRPRRPAAPDSLTATPLPAAVLLDWVAPFDLAITGYGAFVSTLAGGTFSPAGSAATAPLTVGGLTSQQTHWFQVAAYTAAGVLGDRAGPVACVPTSAGTGPPIQAEEWFRPRSLQVTVVTVYAAIGRPRLTWYPGAAPPAGPADYNVYRANQSSGPYRLTATKTSTVGPGSPITWIDYFAWPGGWRWYYVTYYDPGNDFESLPSSPAGVAV